MAASELLRLIVEADTKGAVTGLEQLGAGAKRNLGETESRLDKAGRGLQKFGTVALASGALVVSGLVNAGHAASDLEQSVGGTEAVFGDAASTIERYGDTAAEKMGLSERAFREATTSIGGNLKRMGFDVDTAAEQSANLTQVAADLAATYGGTTAEAVGALGAAFRGEADPAERFNLNLKASAVNAKAVEMGLAASTTSVDENAKAQALLALITEQSADAQGQFAREADTASGSMQIATAEMENAKATLGQTMAPIMADVASGAAKVASGFMSIDDASGGMLSKLVTFGAIGLTAAGGLSIVVGKAIEAREHLSGLSRLVTNSTGGLNKLGKAGVVVGVALAGWQLGKTIQGLTEAKINIDELATALGDLSAAEEQEIQGLAGVLDQWGKLDGVVKDLADTNVIAAERMIEHAEAAGVDSEKIAELREITEGKRQGDVQATKDQALYNEQQAAAVGPLEANAEATEAVTSALGAYDSALKGLFDPLFAMTDALASEADAQAKVNELKTSGSAKAGELEAAEQDLAQAVIASDSAALGLAKAMEEGSVSMDGARRRLDEWVASGRLTREQADRIAEGLGIAAGKADAYSGTYTATILADTGQAEAALARVREAMASVRRTVAVNVSPWGNNAKGTPYWKGGMTWVGERGPELVDLPRGSAVYPREKSVAMAASAGIGGPDATIAGGTQHVHLYLDGQEIAEVMIDRLGLRNLRQNMRAAGTSSRSAQALARARA